MAEVEAATMKRREEANRHHKECRARERRREDRQYWFQEKLDAKRNRKWDWMEECDKELQRHGGEEAAEADAEEDALLDDLVQGEFEFAG